MTASNGWDIEPGETLKRSELHDRWGGSRYGGMEPSVRADSVFLFTKPSAGEAFGYKYDGWQADGSFAYTGDGQSGDQSEHAGGNKALLDTRHNGRAVRLFRSRGTDTTYIGQFELDETAPVARRESSGRKEHVRQVLVFRLRPVGVVVHESQDDADPVLGAPVELPIESADTEGYVASRPDEPPAALRREVAMVARYERWLGAQGQRAVRHRIPLPNGTSMLTDLYNTTTKELVEAKHSAARPWVRTGLGQVLDYSRFLDHDRLALLLGSRPTDDLVELLRRYGVSVIWERPGGFDRIDAF